MIYSEEAKKIYGEVCDKYKHHWLDTTISQTMAMEMIEKALTPTAVVQVKPEVCDVCGFCTHPEDGSCLKYGCDNY